MKASIFGLLLATYSMESMAVCPSVDTIVREYGISSWGFKKQIPRSNEPAKNDSTKKDIIVVTLPTPEHVSDAFVHSILISAEKNEAWISRTGGLAGVQEWYGPILVEGSKSELESCAPAKPSNMTMNLDSLAAASHLTRYE
jgi:hypothetical protein